MEKNIRNTVEGAENALNEENRLGHTNPKITLEYYAHLLPNANDEVADIFHNALQIPSNDLEEEDNKKR